MSAEGSRVTEVCGDLFDAPEGSCLIREFSLPTLENPQTNENDQMLLMPKAYGGLVSLKPLSRRWVDLLSLEG